MKDSKKKIYWHQDLALLNYLTLRIKAESSAIVTRNNSLVHKGKSAGLRIHHNKLNARQLGAILKKFLGI